MLKIIELFLDLWGRRILTKAPCREYIQKLLLGISFSSTQPNKPVERHRQSEEQKVEGAHVANLHVKHHNICIHLHYHVLTVAI